MRDKNWLQTDASKTPALVEEDSFINRCTKQQPAVQNNCQAIFGDDNLKKVINAIISHQISPADLLNLLDCIE